MHIGGIVQEINRPSETGPRLCLAQSRLDLALNAGVACQEASSRTLIIEGSLFDRTLDEALIAPYVLESAYGFYGYVWQDKQTDEIIIGTDRFGYFPIYYAFEDGRFIFGSTINIVKAQLKQRTPDYDAWEELLVLGEVLGGKSTVREIKRLGDGQLIHIKRGRVEFRRFWQVELPEFVDEATYVRENNRLLDEALALTAPQARPKIVLLSGGEDSRRLAVAAVRQGLEVEFYTQQTIYKRDQRHYVDADSKLAARIAGLLNRPHVTERLPPDEQYLIDWKHRDLLFGFECNGHEWLLPMVRRIPSPSLVYDGIVGDVTINGHYCKSHPEALSAYRDAEALAGVACRSADPPWQETLRAQTTTPLRERVAKVISQYPETPHRFTLYQLFNHSRRKASCAPLLFANAGHWIAMPFLYYPLFVQSLSLDPKLQQAKHYQRECLAAVSPKIMTLPTTRQLPIPEEWLTSLDRESARQTATLMGHLTISEEAFELFPSFKTRYRALDAARNLASGPFKPLRSYLAGPGWFLPMLARYSAFLEWLKA